jgi:hypothetical protein
MAIFIPPLYIREQKAESFKSFHRAWSWRERKRPAAHALRATFTMNAKEHGRDIAKVQDWFMRANTSRIRLYNKQKGRPEKTRRSEWFNESR